MRDIAQSGRERIREYRRRRADERAWSPTALGTVPPSRVGPLPSPDRFELHESRRLPSPPRGTVGLFAVGAVVVLLLFGGWRITRVSIHLQGIRSTHAVTPDETTSMALLMKVSGGHLSQTQLSFDGGDVTDQATVADGMVRWKPGRLSEGDHELRLSIPRSYLPTVSKSWTITVDGTPPHFNVPPHLPAHGMHQAVDISGSVDGADALTVNGKAHPLPSDGTFHLHYAAPPPGPIRLVAHDEAGNVRTASIYVPVTYPKNVHGVHVTSSAWANPRLRQGVIDLINEGLINDVELDVKDEGGIVGYTSRVPMARKVGAVQDLYDLKKQVDFLHHKGIRVTGRIVAFRDPKLAGWAWSHGHRDWVIQDPKGGRYGLYSGGFTNFANAHVQQYNVDLAVEAVKAGIDDILWDYVRRPDGYIDTMRFPGIKGDPSDVVAGFLAKSHTAVRRLGAVQGASVFGIAATRPEQIAQDILKIASHTDYVAPMLYPSHWNAGEYGLDDPGAHPYEIVKRAMRDFQQQVFRTGRPLVPWIQHFSLHRVYTAQDVVAQVRAAHDMGYDGWFMWDPQVTYDAAALRGADALD